MTYTKKIMTFDPAYEKLIIYRQIMLENKIDYIPMTALNLVIFVSKVLSPIPYM